MFDYLAIFTVSFQAVVCLVDVSASMGGAGAGGKTHLGHAVTAIDLFVQQKVLCSY